MTGISSRQAAKPALRAGIIRVFLNWAAQRAEKNTKDRRGGRNFPGQQNRFRSLRGGNGRSGGYFSSTGQSLEPKSSKLLAWLLCGAAILLSAGCASTREGIIDDLRETQYFTPASFTGEPRLPVGLRRVLLLPVYGGTQMPAETARSLEEVFAAELQRQVRFEVVRLSRTECQRRFGAPEFSSAAALPHDFLAVLGREFGADGVLFVDLTTYRAYRPLALGVRAKLATVERTRLVWSFDEVFSADNPAVSNSARRYYAATDPAGVPMKAGHGALQSPGKFASYVAAATFNTLPPR